MKLSSKSTRILAYYVLAPKIAMPHVAPRWCKRSITASDSIQEGADELVNKSVHRYLSESLWRMRIR
ncbi:hypothetical protein O9993_06585 [Vibrio lentus]|nr:hypothetical protein [Vibrio lentus]